MPANITKTIFPPLEDKMFLDCVPHLSINISDRPVALCCIEFEDFFFLVVNMRGCAWVSIYRGVNVFVWSVSGVL